MEQHQEPQHTVQQAEDAAARKARLKGVIRSGVVTKVWPLVALLALSSCNLLQKSEAAPKLATSAVQKERILMDALAGFDQIIDASNADAAVKAEYHRRVAEYRTAYSTLQQADLELFAQMTGVDWKAAFDQLYGAWKGRKTQP